MQAAKDSFYVLLRDRLAGVDPSRTVTVNGTVQPAIVVAENSSATAAALSDGCFSLHFGPAEQVQTCQRSSQPLMVMGCTVAYQSDCDPSQDRSDRGRRLAALDMDLLQMTVPGSTAKMDYTKTPAATMGSNVFWTVPTLGEVNDENGTLRREAKLNLFFYPEVQA